MIAEDERRLETVTDESPSTQFQRAFGIFLAACFFFAFVWMIRGQLIPLFLAAVLAALFHPLFLRLTRVLKTRKNVAAGITIFALIVLVVAPTVALLSLFVEQASSIGATASPWIERQLDSLQTRLSSPHFAPFGIEIDDAFVELDAAIATARSEVAQFGLRFLSGLTSSIGRLALDLFVMLYAIFFFLKNGPKLLERATYYGITITGVREDVFGRIFVVARATIRGTIVIAVVQGALGGLGFAAAGIDGAVFWGAMMMLLSILPIVGTAIVWLPACIILLLNGDILVGGLLLLWCVFVVSMIDNILRPILVGTEAKLPDLIVLVSTLGGLSVFGGAGLIIGPVAAAVSLTALEVAARTANESE